MDNDREKKMLAASGTLMAGGCFLMILPFLLGIVAIGVLLLYAIFSTN